jgi:asparagine synthase (glutamine-hydrolysing)
MCGIAGSVNLKNANRALAYLKHRGPDSHGVWSNESVEFVHLRLAIVDLTESGHQPMTFKQWVITFNGEIYNYLEVKQELCSLGYSFTGHSDTEVILKSIDAWGIEQTLPRLNGMWAMALYNTESNTLILCRDRVGKKPLHYSFKNRTFVFASEIGAFPPEYRSETNPLSLVRFVSLGFIPSPDTYYQSIQKLPPASYLLLNTITLENSLHTYWKMPPEKNNQITFEEAVRESETLIRSSISYRLLADVEVGSFLSGGIDSSLITALAQQQSSKKIKTFSIGFDIDKYNESRFAADIASFIGTDHHEFIFRSNDILATIEDYCASVDEPFGDSAILPTLLLSKMTKQHVTVALSGDGGDELYAGYIRYFFTQKYARLFSRIPKPLRGLIASVLKKIQPEKAHKLAFAIQNPTIENIYSVLMFSLSPWEVSGIFGSDFINEIMPKPSFKNLLHIDEQLDPFDIIGSAAHIDCLQNLPEMMLHKVDRATMHYSLEARAPLLDYRLVEYAARIPTHIKTKGNESKPILKHILYNQVPKKMVDRPKRGFSVPMKEWFRNELKEMLLEKILSLDQTIFNQSKLIQMYNLHQEGKANYQALFFNLLQIK